MVVKVIPAAVLSRGMVVREEQLSNIEVKSVPAAVLSIGIVAREEQVENMPLKFDTVVVFKDTLLRERQLRNKYDALVIAVLRMVACSRLEKVMF